MLLSVTSDLHLTCCNPLYLRSWWCILNMTMINSLSRQFLTWLGVVERFYFTTKRIMSSSTIDLTWSSSSIDVSELVSGFLLFEKYQIKPLLVLLLSDKSTHIQNLSLSEYFWTWTSTRLGCSLSTLLSVFYVLHNPSIPFSSFLLTVPR